MNEKTEELRDIFMDVSEEESITEQQVESPGTLAGDASIEDRVSGVLDRMRDRYAFDTPLDDASLITVARGFYDDRPDADIAKELDVGASDVFEARLALHLITDADRDAPFPFETLRRAVTNDDDAIVESIDADPDTIATYRAVAEAEAEMRQANYQFRDQLDDILGDGDVAQHLTRDVTDDGLKDATEGLEVNTAF